MKKLLLASAALLALSAPASAAVINLPANPTSATGAFNTSPGAGAFEDQVTFQLTGGPQFVVIANATNTYADPGSDPIIDWVASIWSAGDDGIVNNTDDSLLFGPQSATLCGTVPSCQFVGGSGTIENPGLYYAEFTGIGSGTSGYGGNISTAAVPGPLAGAGIPGLIALAGLFGFGRWRKRKTALAT